jgi:hypothetical protein
MDGSSSSLFQEHAIAMTAILVLSLFAGFCLVQAVLA